MLNLSALLMLTAGLVSFGAFHFTPGFEANAGWEVWLEVGEMLRDPSLFSDPAGFVILASFLMITLLIVSAPFLTGILRKSRLCWWMATIMSGLATIAFIILLLRFNVPSRVGIGGWLLVAAPVFNLLGLLMIRGSRHASPLG